MTGYLLGHIPQGYHLGGSQITKEQVALGCSRDGSAPVTKTDVSPHGAHSRLIDLAYRKVLFDIFRSRVYKLGLFSYGQSCIYNEEAVC